MTNIITLGILLLALNVSACKSSNTEGSADANINTTEIVETHQNVMGNKDELDKSNSKKVVEEKAETLDKVTAQAIQPSPSINNVTGKNFTAIKLIGKSYVIPNDQDKSIQKIEEMWVSFFYEEFYNEINIIDENIYVVYSDYEKNTFKAFMGYHVGDYNTIPEGTITKTTPSGQYGVFNIKDESESAYLNAWAAADKLGKQRSYEADLEVYKLNWETYETTDAEIRVHLK